MKTSLQQSPTKLEACSVGSGYAPPGRAAMMVALLLLTGCLTLTLPLAGAPLVPFTEQHHVTNSLAESAGPTLHLDHGRGEAPGNLVAEFMYFVPLISLEPVSVIKSPGNTQRTRMVSATRSFAARSFLVACEFEFVGEGKQRNVFDHTEKIRRHEPELKKGGSLTHQLSSINVEGAGSIRIEVEGMITGRVSTVTEVRLHFNGHGRPSPVTIGLHDIRYLDGAFVPRRETVARVNTLVFRRKPGPPKMSITVASVKRKDASDNFWRNLMGGLKGTAVNLFLEPVPVEPAGNEAILNFGLALASEAPSFTFPRSQNLKASGMESAHEAMATR